MKPVVRIEEYDGDLGEDNYLAVTISTAHGTFTDDEQIISYVTDKERVARLREVRAFARKVARSLKIKVEEALLE